MARIAPGVASESWHIMHAEQLAFQDPGAMAPQSVRSAAWH